MWLPSAELVAGCSTQGRASQHAPPGRAGRVEEGGTGQPVVGDVHSSTALLWALGTPCRPPKETSLPNSSSPPPPPPPPARPAGRLLPDAQNSSQPSETRSGPSGPSVARYPTPILTRAPGVHPVAVCCSSQAAATHPTHIFTTTPTPKTHQFPAELAQEAVKPSAVHVGAGAVHSPGRPAYSPITRGSGAEWAGSARQWRPHPCLTPRLLALRSSRRCRPNIWQPRPAPPPAP